MCIPASLLLLGVRLLFKAKWELWIEFILKTLSTQPNSDYSQPLIAAQTVPAAGESPQLWAWSHSVIRASPPERNGMRLGAPLIWEQLSCRVVYHLGDHVHPLGVSEGNSEHRHEKNMAPLDAAETKQSTTAEHMICVASAWRIPNRRSSQRKSNHCCTRTLSHHSLWGQTHYKVQAEAEEGILIIIHWRFMHFKAEFFEWVGSISLMKRNELSLQ